MCGHDLEPNIFLKMLIIAGWPDQLETRAFATCGRGRVRWSQFSHRDGATHSLLVTHYPGCRRNYSPIIGQHIKYMMLRGKKRN